jgi:hypothetical protein
VLLLACLPVMHPGALPKLAPSITTTGQRCWSRTSPFSCICSVHAWSAHGIKQVIKSNSLHAASSSEVHASPGSWQVVRRGLYVSLERGTLLWQMPLPLVAQMQCTS